METDLSLSELIRYVREQLHVAAETRREADLRAILRVESVVIEVNVVATKTAKGHGGIDLKVITAGGAKEHQRQEVHKITLNLRAKAPDEPQYDDDLEEE
ncbi:MAG TPA: trypco2 family protein [Planctomycetota bacterium]|nr:trypco2 family protein [Planctomycetota bacterium]